MARYYVAYHASQLTSMDAGMRSTPSSARDGRAPHHVNYRGDSIEDCLRKERTR